MTQHYITYCWDFPFLAMSLLRKLKRPFPWIANWFAYLCVLMDNTPCQEEIKKTNNTSITHLITMLMLTKCQSA